MLAHGPGAAPSICLGDVVAAFTAAVEPAVPALPDAPVGPGVAEVAGPLDQVIVGLDDLERMRATADDGHREPRRW